MRLPPLGHPLQPAPPRPATCAPPARPHLLHRQRRRLEHRLLAAARLGRHQAQVAALAILCLDGALLAPGGLRQRLQARERGTVMREEAWGRWGGQAAPERRQGGRRQGAEQRCRRPRRISETGRHLSPPTTTHTHRRPPTCLPTPPHHPPTHLYERGVANAKLHPRVRGRHPVGAQVDDGQQVGGRGGDDGTQGVGEVAGDHKALQGCGRGGGGQHAGGGVQQQAGRRRQEAGRRQACGCHGAAHPHPAPPRHHSTIPPTAPPPHHTTPHHTTNRPHLGLLGNQLKGVGQEAEGHRLALTPRHQLAAEGGQGHEAVVGL